VVSVTVRRELLYQCARVRVKAGGEGSEEVATRLAEALNSGVKPS